MMFFRPNYLCQIWDTEKSLTLVYACNIISHVVCSLYTVEYPALIFDKQFGSFNRIRYPGLMEV